MLVTIICFLLAVICFVISVLQFMEKGFCFSKDYLCATDDERKNMNKRAYYRQAAIVFSLLCCNFIVVGIYTITHLQSLLMLEIMIIVSAVVFQAISSTFMD